MVTAGPSTFGEHLESNWGAVYGGALAAATAGAGPGRRARPCHPVRCTSRSCGRFRVGAAYATARMRHAGRTVGTVEVDVFDRAAEARGHCARHHGDADRGSRPATTTRAPFRFASGRNRVPLGRDSFESPVTRRARDDPDRRRRQYRLAADGRCAAERRRVGGAGAADHRSVGEPRAHRPRSRVPRGRRGRRRSRARVVRSQTRRWDRNADLSLRFTTAPATPRGPEPRDRWCRSQHGTATVAIEVQAGDQQLAHGLSTSLLLPPR